MEYMNWNLIRPFLYEIRLAISFTNFYMKFLQHLGHVVVKLGNLSSEELMMRYFWFMFIYRIPGNTMEMPGNARKYQEIPGNTRKYQEFLEMPGNARKYQELPKIRIRFLFSKVQDHTFLGIRRSTSFFRGHYRLTMLSLQWPIFI